MSNYEERFDPVAYMRYRTQSQQTKRKFPVQPAPAVIPSGYCGWCGYILTVCQCNTDGCQPAQSVERGEIDQ